jgi:SHS2 domain-containing protein
LLPEEGAYEYFDHAADVGIRCRAPSVEGLFQAAGRALMEWMGPAPGGEETATLEAKVEGQDREDLLVRWLQELVYLFQTKHLYFVAVESVFISDRTLQGEFLFKRWDESSHGEFQEVKAVTYHQLRVFAEGGSWHASVILDI